MAIRHHANELEINVSTVAEAADHKDRSSGPLTF